MKFTVQFTVEARRSGDTAALAAELEPLFRRQTVGDADLDRTVVVPRKRGGTIQFWATVDDRREMLVARLRDLADSIDSNRNLIDRIDEYRAAAHLDAGIVGFVQGDFRGWLREIAAEESRS